MRFLNTFETDFLREPPRYSSVQHRIDPASKADLHGIRRPTRATVSPMPIWQAPLAMFALAALFGECSSPTRLTVSILVSFG